MLDFANVRAQIPGLNQVRDGVTPIFLDGPAGTQVPKRVIDAFVRDLTHCNANHGGVFATSVESDRDPCRRPCRHGRFLNAGRPPTRSFSATT